MQNASREYKNSMAAPYRNRAYIRISIGVINSDAQRTVNAESAKNDFTYYSNRKKLFDGYTVDKEYATCEQNFSKVNGEMYFLPKQTSGMSYYNNGLVSNGFMGAIYINFSASYSLDIKGLRINWGEYYPIDFSIENDEGVHSYSGNDRADWTTEDTFNGTTYLIIRVSKMQNRQLRLRIHEFTCGIVNIFTNKDVKSYTAKEFVSPITETVPSQDTTIIVDNQKLYYSPDNPESTLAYMEVGQEIKVAFGYDVTGNDDIEWLPETTTYLKNWSATDVEAKFTGTDRFDYLTDNYYKGHYYPQGISLYDLSLNVLEDAGIVDSREYFLDPYLKNIIVHNPIPVVTHAAALQIIANAGRCALSADRQKRIHMQSSFIPEMSVVSNGETAYSNVDNILNNELKNAYAISSNDFSKVDGSVLFMSKNNFYNTGYVSDQLADENGDFETNPTLTITLEASFIAYGLAIDFRNVAPVEFEIRTYNQEQPVNTFIYSDPETKFVTNDQFVSFTKLELEITKGYPNARVTIDNVRIVNITDYTINRRIDLTGSPTATRQNKIKSINVERTLYSLSKAGTVDLKTEELVLNAGNTEYTVYLSKASYEYAIAVTDQSGNATIVTCSIIKSDNFYVILQFHADKDNTVVKYTLSGKEYNVEYNMLIVPHNDSGEVKLWSNPLVSSISHAKELEEWLATYFLGDVIYEIPWRGDPRVDANDLFYLETKEKGEALIRGYENTLQFNGAWSSIIKARRAVLSWQ